MSRKLLSLGYIYEMKKKHKEALACFERIAESDKKDLSKEMLTEARLAIKANHIAIKFLKDEKLMSANLNLTKLQEKIEQFKNNDKAILRWLTAWR